MHSMRIKRIHVMTAFVLLCFVGCGSSLINVEDQISRTEIINIIEPDTPNVNLPAVMINDILFVQCWTIITFEDDDVNIDGTITSSVSLSEWPHLENQTNWCVLLGAPYIIHEDGVAVFMDYRQEWSLFRPR